MKAKDKKAARELALQLGVLLGKAQDIMGELETIRDSEQEAYDAHGETWQDSDKGAEASAACRAWEEACDSVSEMTDSAERAISSISEAIGE